MGHHDSLFSIATYKISKMAANMATKNQIFKKYVQYIVFILLYLQQLQQWYHGRWLDLEEAIRFQ